MEHWLAVLAVALAVVFGYWVGRAEPTIIKAVVAKVAIRKRRPPVAKPAKRVRPRRRR